jgi:hypothetical protein
VQAFSYCATMMLGSSPGWLRVVGVSCSWVRFEQPFVHAPNSPALSGRDSKDFAMMNVTRFLAGAAAAGTLAAPAAAQYSPPTYPQQAYPGYNPGYGYNQGTTGNPVTDIIDSLLGNRYNVTDRQAIRQCANAARAQAAQQYGGGYNNAYGNGYNNGYRQQGYAGANLRVTSITEVQRRGNGLRVSGTMGSGAGYGGGQYGYQNGYQNRGYANAGLSFRCNVAYNGAVTGIRIRPANAY